MSLALDIVTIIAVSAGAFFFLAGTVGLLRFPDALTRLHALWLERLWRTRAATTASVRAHRQSYPTHRSQMPAFGWSCPPVPLPGPGNGPAFLTRTAGVTR